MHPPWFSLSLFHLLGRSMVCEHNNILAKNLVILKHTYLVASSPKFNNTNVTFTIYNRIHDMLRIKCNTCWWHKSVLFKSSFTNLNFWMLIGAWSSVSRYQLREIIIWLTITDPILHSTRGVPSSYLGISYFKGTSMIGIGEMCDKKISLSLVVFEYLLGVKSHYGRVNNLD